MIADGRIKIRSNYEKHITTTKRCNNMTNKTKQLTTKDLERAYQRGLHDGYMLCRKDAIAILRETLQ